ncbi:hypothetical protein LshimejAT787_1001990 [Lyophyllum shimeji]|uniref:Uncharacterized protein n=1 Tax=Lyophyllum shimeji TaxID=47721 RepID=A0A9P3PU46_LYOSH|nr:hypothetical protein LshimejAT787_1001990 [Lyophyllum shimeji]
MNLFSVYADDVSAYSFACRLLSAANSRAVISPSALSSDNVETQQLPLCTSPARTTLPSAKSNTIRPSAIPPPLQSTSLFTFVPGSSSCSERAATYITRDRRYRCAGCRASDALNSSILSECPSTQATFMRMKFINQHILTDPLTTTGLADLPRATTKFAFYSRLQAISRKEMKSPAMTLTIGRKTTTN